MYLRTALNDYKRTREEKARFPGERRTWTGLFSGLDDRLVHVERDGGLRDFSRPLTGMDGIARSRFGLDRGEGTTWFDDAETKGQEYDGRTALVVTRFDLDGTAVAKYDLTVGKTHYTHVRAPDAGDARLRVFLTFAPGGHDDRVGKLVHGDAVECYRDRERDVLAADRPFAEVDGHVPERFAELLEEEPTELPRYRDGERSEDSRLGGDLDLSVPLDGDGVTVATTLYDRESSPDRSRALSTTRDRVRAVDGPDALREAAREQGEDVPTTSADVAFEDLRVLSLLSAPTGARIAGPDFDPLYAHSGGYGYTWFRDDAEIARYLLDAADALTVDLGEWHERSARFFLDTQLADGTWPHRVWPHDGTLAPGWANGRLEEDPERYQADQTASVAAFLADYLRVGDPPDGLRTSIVDGLESAIAGLDDHLADDGLPITCQNAWENMTGRFTHTAATHLLAYASIARSPVPEDIATRAGRRGKAVHEALSDLWTGDVFALRRTSDGLDPRLDSSTFALTEAHAAYAAIGDLPDRRAQRLAAHLDATLSGLWRDPPESDVRGLTRFEGDVWRTRDQAAEKIWTVSTAWGASAAHHATELLEDRVEGPDFEAWTRTLLGSLDPDGPLSRAGGYFPEQVFDDGTPDSATPLGWSHALRLATVSNTDVSIEGAPREPPVGRRSRPPGS